MHFGIRYQKMSSCCASSKWGGAHDWDFSTTQKGELVDEARVHRRRVESPLHVNRLLHVHRSLNRTAQDEVSQRYDGFSQTQPSFLAGKLRG